MNVSNVAFVIRDAASSDYAELVPLFPFLSFFFFLLNNVRIRRKQEQFNTQRLHEALGNTCTAIAEESTPPDQGQRL